MLLLILLIFGIAFIVPAAAALYGCVIGMWISFLSRLEAVKTRVLLSVCLAFVLILLSIPTASCFMSILPDFAKPGDGGVGLVYKLLAKISVMLSTPGILALPVLGLLHFLPAKVNQESRETFRDW